MVTDVDSGDTTTFSITNQPSWASFDTTTGTLTGTPINADIGTNSGILITVTDTANTTDSLTAFDITVSNTNDAPVISGTPSTMVAEDATYSFTPVVTDVDSGDTTTFSITNKPRWASFDTTTGALTGTPTNIDVGTSSGIVITVTDTANTTDSLTTFAIEVINTNNAPVAVDDEYSFSVFDLISLDVMLNDSDPEDDKIELMSAQTNSGEVDIVEGMLVFTPEQGVSGVISITYTIKDIEGNVASAVATVTIASEQEPVITIPEDLCGDLTVNSTGLYTRIDLGEASAIDRFGNTIPVSLIDGVSLYPPGRSEAYWQATDIDGNTVIKKQLVCVNPLVSIDSDQQVSEGTSVEVTIFLNGEAPVYPMVIPYDVVGNDDDHTLTSGEVMIASGTEVHLSFDIVKDDLVEDDEIVEVMLSNTLNLGPKNSHLFTITEDNIAPVVSLDVMQQQENRAMVSQVDGDVVVMSTVYDANQGDSLTYQWQVSDDNLINLSEDEGSFSFNPVDIALGAYQISLIVNDDASSQGVDMASVYINIVSELIELTDIDSDGDGIPDNIEGYKDSDGDGTPDYRDKIAECNVLQEAVLVNDAYLIEGQSGVCLRLGNLTISAQTSEEKITDKEILRADPEATNVGGIFDYVSYGLPVVGTSVSIVLPQKRPIPANAVYRKYRETTGWAFFIEDVNNSLWSAPGEPGYCPPPNDSAWSLGLTEGYWCVQQVIEDGGVNDDDLTVNGTVVDPGGVAVMTTTNHFPVAVDDHLEVYFNSDVLRGVSIDALGNDTDEDNNTLVITSANSNIGEVTIVDGLLWYTRKNNYVGSITIDYGLSDNNGGSDHGVVYLEMLLNKAPVVNNESSQMNQGQSVSLNLLDNDTDPDNDALTLVAVDNNAVSFTENGQVTFTPHENFFGSVTINYTVQDSAGNSATGVWSITVTEVIIIKTKTTGGVFYWLMLLLMLVLLIRTLMQSRNLLQSRNVAKGQQ